MNSSPVNSVLSSNANHPSVVNPLCIILVKNGSKGDRLLFRYPYSKNKRGGKKSGDKAKARAVVTGVEDVVNTSFVSSPGGGDSVPSPPVTQIISNIDPLKSGWTSPSYDQVDGGKLENEGEGQDVKEEETSPLQQNESEAPAIGDVTSPGGVPPLTVSKSPTSVGTTKSLLDTPLSQLSSKSFTPSPAIAGAGPDFGRVRKVSRVTAPSAPLQISRGDDDNPYSVSKNPSDDLFAEPSFANSTADGRKFSLDGSEMLKQLSDKNLSNLLAVSSDLGERKFELKLNFVRFVGHPTLMHNPKDVRPINPEFQTSVKIFHIVFCLNAAASHSIVKCFFDLSKRLGIGLRHEEYRCGFLNQEMRKIILMHDEACTAASEHLEDKEDPDNVQERVFDAILAKSRLAQLLKRVYDDVCNTGYTFARINNWVQISFCLPHRVHMLPFRKHAALVEPEIIHKCLEAIRPYHALLLLVEPNTLLTKFWLDCSSTIPRLVQVYSPLKSLQTLAADADLTLSQVVEVASHLVYWAHATVIYPLCESNVYFLAPDTPIDSPELEAAFRRKFPQASMIQVFSDFSLAIPLGERMNPMIGGSYNQQQLVELVTWMLQRRLLIQLHTYIYMATYLDLGGSQEQNLDQISVSIDPDIRLNLNIRPFDFPEEDDITVSDTYSENIGDDMALLNLNNSLPVQQHQQSETKENDKEVENKEANDTDKIPDNSTKQSEAGDAEKNPEESPTKQSEEDRSKQTNNNEESMEPLDKFKASLPELNNEAVKRAVGIVNKASISLQDIKMFSGLAKYFTGEFHVEEIMYRENVRRSQLMLLLDKFRECLITIEKEDADITFIRNTEMS